MVRSRRNLAALVAAAALVAGVAGADAARVTTRIEGLDEDLADAVEDTVEIRRYRQRNVSAAQVRRLFERGKAQAAKALEPYGYYHAKVEAELAETERGYVATYRIDRGEPVRVTALSIEIDGDARERRLVRRALSAFDPDEGDILDHADYETGKRDIQGALIASGYLDAELVEHRVEVSAAENSARITLAWKAGPRYVFGATSFSGAQFDDALLARYVPYTEGEFYSQAELLELQQRLTDAEYFSVVEVAPDVEKASGGVVPINVAVIPAKRSLYTGGFFVGTDTGFGVRGALERRYVNRRGHKLGVAAEYSQRLRTLATTYTIPLPGRDNRSWNFGAAYRDETTDTSESRTIRLAANETREWRDWTLGYGPQFVTGDFTVAEEDGETTLLYPEVSLSRKKADDVNFPRRGWSMLAVARGGLDGALSDTTFLQLRGDAKYVRGIGERGRFIARGTLGAMHVDDFGKLPPELRFFAGGDRSIRGYEYQAIGPRNARELVVGGEYLAVASAEYEHYFLEKWGGAVFVDAGDAFTRDFDPKIGAGVGVRWRSPVGMVRLDFAVPVDDAFESGVQFHLAIGPDL
ncbi:MAG TPA: autotransporter assembly complex family protein [Xanthomonadales bacterium]|nr:autotransporter assembly complex family protein [Xanthomonadales bacterium]